MERRVLIQELSKTSDGLEITGGFPEEEYIGAIYDYGEAYLVTKRNEDVFLKPCIIDASVEVTPNGPVTQAEFYFNREETTFNDSPATKELLESIAKTGKPKGNIEFDQSWDFHAYFVERDLYLELKEMKESYPTRTVRDAVLISSLEAKVDERQK